MTVQRQSSHPEIFGIRTFRYLGRNFPKEIFGNFLKGFSVRFDISIPLEYLLLNLGSSVKTFGIHFHFMHQEVGATAVYPFFYRYTCPEFSRRQLSGLCNFPRIHLKPSFHHLPSGHWSFYSISMSKSIQTQTQEKPRTLTNQNHGKFLSLCPTIIEPYSCGLS